jgi:phosphate/sulfate permease
MGFICAMIWLLALIVLAAGVGMGLRLGVIPTTVSFLALIIASSFAALLGGLFQHVVSHLVSNPVVAWMIAPIIGFFVVYMILMSIGFEVHRRVNVFYKYKAGDLRLALWERLNLRLGGCVGVLNGTAWLVLICFFVFNLSYVTAQIAPSEKEAAMTRFMNNLGQGLQSTGMDKPARAVGSVPGSFYKTADFAGLLAQNPALSQRLGNYPAFISLSQNSDIQALEQDSTLVDDWQQGKPMGEIMNDSQIKNILNNTNLVDAIWNIIQTNMDDMTNFLFTGQSPKFDSEKIVGFWAFDPIPSLAEVMQAHPDIKFTTQQMAVMRGYWVHTFTNITLVAGTDGQVFLYNMPKFSPKNPLQETGTENDTGQWTSDDGTNYQMTGTGDVGSTTATTDGMRLSVDTGKGFPLIFRRVYQSPN